MSLNESPNLEQSALRLPTLSMTPSVDKLREALRLATNNVQNVIQLPWKSSNSPVQYMVKVGCQANAQEPAWVLHVGGEADETILWNYNTSDCQMIHDLIAAEVTRATYAAAQQAPVQPPQQAPMMAAPQIVDPPAPPLHLSQNVQPAPKPTPNPSYDWGAGQSATQQGQDWNWSNPSVASADQNWSTSGHPRLPLPSEPIVQINDPQAFSQSWGTPSPSISAPDTGLQRNTKPPGVIQPEPKPPESSIFLSGPLAQGGRNPASQTLGLPQMQPVEPLSSPANVPLPEFAAVPAPPFENQSLPIGGFAHTQPFADGAAVQPPVDSAADGGAPGLATLDSVPVLDGSLQPPDVASGDAIMPLPAVPSSRALTSTLSATLPLDVQETLTPDEDNLTAPRVDVADMASVQSALPSVPQPEPQPMPSFDLSPVEAASIEAPVTEPDKKQTNRRKGRGSKLNLPAVKAPTECGDVVDTDIVAAASMTPDAVQAPPPAPSFMPPVQQPAAFDPTTLFEPEIPAAQAPAPVVEPACIPEAPPVAPPPSAPVAFVSPLSIDLSSIPPLPAVADFAAANARPEAPLAPPPFAVEFDTAESAPPEQPARAAAPEEQDPTVPMNIATGDDINNARALHEPPTPVADLPLENQQISTPAPVDVASSPAAPVPDVSAPVATPVAPAEVPVEQKATPEAPKRALPQPAPFNREAVDDIFKHLTNQETGFITNSAFMFFIVREFSRFQKAQTPITLIGFDLALRAPDGAMYPVHLAALRECGRRFFSVMRPLDWLAHYSDDEYALLLPHTNIRESILLVKDLYTVLNSSPLLPGMEDAQVVMHSGIASIPDDCQHPGILIAAAYEAKNEAKRSNLAVQLFRDMPA